MEGTTAAVPVAELVAICGPDRVVTEHHALRTYESDGLLQYAAVPAAAVLPDTTEEVAAVVAACHRAGVPWVARGSGTGLSGGALPVEDGVLISLARMRRIVAVDLPNQRVVVQPGVTNAQVTAAVAPTHFYPPDPSSQIICSIGGNVAENSGGVHCFKYGFTTNYVTGAEVVLPDGEVVRLGGTELDRPGYDLLGAFVGSEGTLGIATKVTLRLLRKPEAVRTLMAAFQGTDHAGDAVSRIIAAGIVPAAIEMMDELAMEAAEAAVHVHYPEGAGAVLIVELDGPAAEVEHLIGRVESIAKDCDAVSVLASNNEAERLLFWAGRKAAFPAVGRISPDYYCMDGTIPRAKLPQVLKRMRELSEHYGLRVANVFHAGDGNLH
ncbi:MAG: FAD-binding protein, partial [Acidimicrobiia bacterium]